MKIKHWQGYGSVNASLISKALNTASRKEVWNVQVSGMHEYGLDCGEYDHYRIYNWLVKKFDKYNKYTESNIEDVKIIDQYIKNPTTGLTEEQCSYTIVFNW